MPHAPWPATGPMRFSLAASADNLAAAEGDFTRRSETFMPARYRSSDLEDAQRQFADVVDGDYLLMVLLDRTAALAAATLTLFAAFDGPIMKPRTVVFRGVDRVVEIQRPPRLQSGMRAIPTDQVTVCVRDGRVVRFTRH
jgi:hypothetical protein